MWKNVSINMVRETDAQKTESSLVALHLVHLIKSLVHLRAPKEKNKGRPHGGCQHNYQEPLIPVLESGKWPCPVHRCGAQRPVNERNTETTTREAMAFERDSMTLEVEIPWYTTGILNDFDL